MRVAYILLGLSPLMLGAIFLCEDRLASSAERRIHARRQQELARIRSSQHLDRTDAESVTTALSSESDTPSHFFDGLPTSTVDALEVEVAIGVRVPSRETSLPH